jgi:hypothetical protein
VADSTTISAGANAQRRSRDRRGSAMGPRHGRGARDGGFDGARGAEVAPPTPFVPARCVRPQPSALVRLWRGAPARRCASGPPVIRPHPWASSTGRTTRNRATTYSQTRRRGRLVIGPRIPSGTLDFWIFRPKLANFSLPEPPRCCILEGFRAVSERQTLSTFGTGDT